MIVILWILEIIVGILLVISVLLQVRGGDAGAFFGGTQSIFGPRGPTTILEKMTYGLIGAFFIITLLISKFSSSERIAPTQEIPSAPSAEEVLPEPATK